MLKLARFRRSVLLTLCALPAFTATVAQTYDSGADPPRPNIILVLADDAGVEAFRPYGGTSYATPNIAALAARGRTFTRAFSQPLCTPSRVQLMTGKQNYRNYEAFGWLDPDEATFAQALRAAGYRTAIAGKWQLSMPEPDRPIEFDAERAAPNVTPTIIRDDYGFDGYSLWQLNHVLDDGRGPRYWNPRIERDGNLLPAGAEDYGPDLNAAYLIDFIEAASGDGVPFLAYFPTALPHVPWVPTPFTVDGRASDEMHSPEHFGANVEYLDHLVGELLAAVDALGIGGRTYLIFTSDNGTARNITSETNSGPVTGAKGHLTIPGTHVPLIIAGPEIQAGSVDHRLVGIADITTTVLAAAGLDAEIESLDGRPLLPVTSDEGKPAGLLYSWYDPKGRNFAPGAVAMSPTRRLYADGRMTAVEAAPVCCVLRELDMAETGRPTEADPQLRQVLLSHEQHGTR